MPSLSHPIRAQLDFGDADKPVRPGGNCDLQTNHVLPALLRRFHEATQSGASEVVVWGAGTLLREVLQRDDLADALVFLLKTYSDYAHFLRENPA